MSALPTLNNYDKVLQIAKPASYIELINSVKRIG